MQVRQPCSRCRPTHRSRPTRRLPASRAPPGHRLLQQRTRPRHDPTTPPPPATRPHPGPHRPHADRLCAAGAGLQRAAVAQRLGQCDLDRQPAGGGSTDSHLQRQPGALLAAGRGVRRVHGGHHPHRAGLRRARHRARQVRGGHGRHVLPGRVGADRSRWLAVHAADPGAAQDA